MNGVRKGTKLDLDDLEQAVGGIAVVTDPEDQRRLTKYGEFERAWNALGFPLHGYTRHQMDALCDQWKERDYTPAAEEFLQDAKQW